VARGSSATSATFGVRVGFSVEIDLRRTHPTRPWVRCWDQRRGPFTGSPSYFKARHRSGASTGEACEGCAGPTEARSWRG